MQISTRLISKRVPSSSASSKSPDPDQHGPGLRVELSHQDPRSGSALARSEGAVGQTSLLGTALLKSPASVAHKLRPCKKAHAETPPERPIVDEAGPLSLGRRKTPAPPLHPRVPRRGIDAPGRPAVVALTASRRICSNASGGVRSTTARTLLSSTESAGSSSRPSKSLRSVWGAPSLRRLAKPS